MFSKVLAILTLGAAVVSATSYSCNVGSLQCCGQLHAPGSASATNLATLVGVALQDVSGQVGAQCNPITAIGAGNGANCAAAPVCCEKNVSNQLVGVNCTPATVGA
ncbi:fungal hydrophobin [Panaeolus papilionaceus]|nr:fungal hydrophobin [Panaeolus papilionaceus]KAF9050162.1 fungal hydrophobin [Panaeolus papilionaceus]